MKNIIDVFILLIKSINNKGGEKMKEKKIYHYKGTVCHFEDIITRNFEDYTMAVSEKQAINQLSFKAKQKYGYDKSALLKLNPKYLK